MRKRLTKLTALFVCAALLLCLAPAAMADELPKAPKNVIIFIADGTGFNAYLAADYYMYGEPGHQIYEQDDWISLAMTTYSLGNQTADDDGISYYVGDRMWDDFKCFRRNCTDSAASATAMASGVKTYDNAIGVDQSGKDITNMAEEFEKLGRSSGVVTTVAMSHATPAGFSVHCANRNSYGEIFDHQFYDSALDVVIGAGHPYYDHAGRPVDTPDYGYCGKETWEKIAAGELTGGDADGDGKADDWTLAVSKEDFTSVTHDNAPDRLLGVLPVKSTAQANRPDLNGSETYTDWQDDLPFQTPLLESVASLAQTTVAALNVLDKNENGFYLMVEGGATDSMNHDNCGGRFIEEFIDFAAAIEAACAWVEQYSSWDETLMIVSDDHETGYVTGKRSEYTLVVNNGKGNMPGMVYNSGSHTNQVVPFFVKGCGAEIFLDYVYGRDNVLAGYYGDAFGITGDYINNVAMAQALRELLGIEQLPDQYPYPEDVDAFWNELYPPLVGDSDMQVNEQAELDDGYVYFNVVQNNAPVTDRDGRPLVMYKVPWEYGVTLGSAVTALHETAYADGAEGVSIGTTSGISCLTKLWGESYPYGAYGYLEGNITVPETMLYSGDVVDMAVYTISYGAGFLSPHSTSAYTGETVVMQANQTYLDFEEFAYVTKGYAAEIWAGTDVNDLKDTGVRGNDYGFFEISFDEPGDYIIVARDAAGVFNAAIGAVHVTQAEKDAVMRSNQTVTVDGETVELDVYNINGSNYFKLRDIAMKLSGTASSFSVGYDSETRTVTCTAGEAYEPNGSELVIGDDLSATAVRSNQPLYVNGELSSIRAYNLGGNNYFQLRELGAALGFEVDYDADTRTVIIGSAK
jgi:alkaline phosphatase